MALKNSIPNLITSANLACGFFAIISISNGDLLFGSLLVLLGAFFDFFDGAAARILNASSPIGAQLDSLSDLVTFGIVPTYIAFVLLDSLDNYEWLKYFAVFIAIASAYRLANFNIDERQTVNFIGLPTPANALFWISIPLIQWQLQTDLNADLASFILANITSPLGLVLSILISSYLLNAEIDLFSLKLKSLKWSENSYRFVLILSSIILLFILYFAAIPFILLLYLLLSFIKNYKESNEIRS